MSRTIQLRLSDSHAAIIAAATNKRLLIEHALDIYQNNVVAAIIHAKTDGLGLDHIEAFCQEAMAETGGVVSAKLLETIEGAEDLATILEAWRFDEAWTRALLGLAA